MEFIDLPHHNKAIQGNLDENPRLMCGSRITHARNRNDLLSVSHIEAPQPGTDILDSEISF